MYNEVMRLLNNNLCYTKVVFIFFGNITPLCGAHFKMRALQGTCGAKTPVRGRKGVVSE